MVTITKEELEKCFGFEIADALYNEIAEQIKTDLDGSIPTTKEEWLAYYKESWIDNGKLLLSKCEMFEDLWNLYHEALENAKSLRHALKAIEESLNISKDLISNIVD